MSNTGYSASSLTARLQAKAAADRQEIEQIMRSELERLGKSLTDASLTALRDMQSSTDRHLQQAQTAQGEMVAGMQRARAGLMLWPLWSGLAAAGTGSLILLGLWLALGWLIGSQKEDLRLLREETARLQITLEDLRSIKGVSVHKQPTGGMVIMTPQAAQVGGCKGADSKPMQCVWLR